MMMELHTQGTVLVRVAVDWAIRAGFAIDPSSSCF